MWLRTPDGRLVNAGHAKVIDVRGPNPDVGEWWLFARFELEGVAYILGIYPGEEGARAALESVASGLASGATLVVL